MSNHSTGHYAEKLAAEYLHRRSYEIIELNWCTKICEIDIVASKNNTIYFIEVKYRKNNLHGFGLDYVTPKKVLQMKKAALTWIYHNSYYGDYRLGTIELSGDNFEVTNFINDV